MRLAKGGNFYPIAINRTSPRFTRTILLDAFEGNTLIADVMDLLNVAKVSTLEGMRRELIG
ncbi:MAG: hypothetical protein OXC81_06055 [Betaproteobacteria bacterium]|nr:hypothetical protein [Betaproteobacteria bacterium]